MRRLLAALTASLLTAALVGIPPAQAVSRPTVTLQVTSADDPVLTSSVVAFAGTVSGKSAGAAVKLQRRVAAGAWSTVAQAKLGKERTYSFEHAFGSAADYEVRVLVSATKRTAKSASAVQSVAVSEPDSDGGPGGDTEVPGVPRLEGTFDVSQMVIDASHGPTGQVASRQHMIVAECSGAAACTRVTFTRSTATELTTTTTLFMTPDQNYQGESTHVVPDAYYCGPSEASAEWSQPGEVSERLVIEPRESDGGRVTTYGGLLDLTYPPFDPAGAPQECVDFFAGEYGMSAGDVLRLTWAFSARVPSDG